MHFIFSGKQFRKGVTGRLASLFLANLQEAERVHVFDGEGDDSEKERLFANIIGKAGPLMKSFSSPQRLSQHKHVPGEIMHPIL